jgi:dipeptidyl-peptidase-3
VVHTYSSREKQYAHYLGEASWAGARIILGQWTPFTEKLYDLLILTFSENGTITDINTLKEKSGLSDDEWDRVLEFASQVIVLSSDLGSRSFISSSTITPGAV